MTSTGVPALDKLLAGGYPPNSAILVEGPSGSEKDMVAYSFVNAGLGEGEFCAYVTRLPPSEMVLDAKAFGIDFTSRPPYWVSPEGGDKGYSLNDLATISFGIKETLRGREGACSRVVIDGLSQLLMLHSTDSVYRFLSQLIPELKKLNAVIVATVQGEMHSPQVLSAIELLFDGVVEVRAVEGAESELHVKKMRGVSLSAKSTRVREAEGETTAPAGGRIAVLPFTNFSPDPGDAYLSDGLTEELISTLSRVDGLEVIARTSVMHYKEAPKPVREVAAELNVGTVLEGSTRRAGKKLRVAVQMLDARKEKHLWSENYDREMEDIFAIQTEISQAVASQVRSKFGGQQGAVNAPKAVDPVAYDYYLKGRHLLATEAEGPEEAARYFRLAIERDPGLAKAYSGLADYYTYMADDTMTYAEAYPKAKEAAEKALALDPGSSDAHTSLALIAYLSAWNWADAAKHFDEALRLNPNNAFAWMWRAGFLKTIGRAEEAMDSLAKAIELDPLFDGTRFLVGMVQWCDHQPAAAIESCRKTIELNRDNGAGHALLGILLLSAGDREGALVEARESVRAGASREGQALIGFLNARVGETAEARRILDELRAGESPDLISAAAVLVGLGEIGAATAALKDGIARHSTYLSLYGVNPIFEELLGDEELVALLRKAGYGLGSKPTQT